VAYSNKAYDKIYYDWIRLSTNIKRKMLIFVVFRYCEMLGRKSLKPCQLALLTKEDLEHLCHSLESEIAKMD